MEFIYNGVTVKVITTKSGKKFYVLNSPVNGTTRMFEYSEKGERYMRNYIDRAAVMEENFAAMGW